jgi:hypothetical protein
MTLRSRVTSKHIQTHTDKHRWTNNIDGQTDENTQTD